MSIEQGDLKPELIGVSDFVADAEGVIDRANATNRPVFLTGRGRFLFLIEPIAHLGLSIDSQEEDK